MHDQDGVIGRCFEYIYPITPSSYTMRPKVISVEDLSVESEGKEILKNINFHVEMGEKFFIMGGDGSGKSALLKVLAGLLNFQKGNVFVFSKELRDLSRKELLETRMRMGFVFQGGGLAANLTVIENIMLPLEYHSIYDKESIPNIARELLMALGMQDYCHHYPAELNIGMKKRVSIARALAMNPELILYDEPSLDFTGLVRRRLEDYIIWLHDKLGLTSIIVTDNIQFSKREADKLLIMDRGRVVAFGSFPELEAGTDEKVKNFLVTGNLMKII